MRARRPPPPRLVRATGRAVGRSSATRPLMAAVVLTAAACGHSSEPPPPLSPAPHQAGPSPTSDVPSDGRFPPPPPLGLQAFLPSPEDNAPTPERAELGRRLFFDPVLSRDSTVSCASCHRPELAFGDSLRFSPGVDGQTGARTTPAVINRGYGASFFWDGRAASLEEGVLLPLENPLELDLPVDSAVARLRADPGYRALFAGAYPARIEEEKPPNAGDAVSRATLGAALATYVRLIRSGAAPADRFAAGEETALSPAAVRGRQLFLGKANCTACHIGPDLTDEEFHATGIAHRSGDPGRAAVTGREEDRAAFKTPTLREVARTAPYMHDGSLRTLEEVVRFYDQGGLPHPNLSPEIEPLQLTGDEKRELIAFLESLSGRLEVPGPVAGEPQAGRWDRTGGAAPIGRKIRADRAGSPDRPPAGPCRPLP